MLSDLKKILAASQAPENCGSGICWSRMDDGWPFYAGLWLCNGQDPWFPLNKRLSEKKNGWIPEVSITLVSLASLKPCFHFISPVVCPPFFLRLSVSKGLSLLRRMIHLQVTLLPQPFLNSLLCPEVGFSKRPCKKLSEIPSWERCWLLEVPFLGLCLGSLASRGSKVPEQSDQLGTPTPSSQNEHLISQ